MGDRRHEQPWHTPEQDYKEIGRVPADKFLSFTKNASIGKSGK